MCVGWRKWQQTLQLENCMFLLSHDRSYIICLHFSLIHKAWVKFQFSAWLSISWWFFGTSLSACRCLPSTPLRERNDKFIHFDILWFWRVLNYGNLWNFLMFMKAKESFSNFHQTFRSLFTFNLICVMPWHRKMRDCVYKMCQLKLDWKCLGLSWKWKIDKPEDYTASI